MMDCTPTIETNNSWSTSVQLRDSVTRQRSCSLYTTTDSLYSGVTSLLYLQALQCRGSAHPEGTKRAIFIAKQWRVWQLFPLRRQRERERERERERDRQTDRQIYTTGESRHRRGHVSTLLCARTQNLRHYDHPRASNKASKASVRQWYGGKRIRQ